jgi:urocanate hydratase
MRDVFIASWKSFCGLIANVDFFFFFDNQGPVMLSRDHHDVSGTDSPWRETSDIKDGSKFCADMAVHNALGDSFRGATSVSLHNGGGE